MSDNVDTAAVRARIKSKDLTPKEALALCDEVDRLRGERVQVGWHVTLDRIARAIAGHNGVPHRSHWYIGQADAVLAVLPQYDQVGWLSTLGQFATKVLPPEEGWEPVYVYRPTEGPRTCPTCGSDDRDVRKVPENGPMTPYRPYGRRVRKCCTDPWHSENRETP